MSAPIEVTRGLTWLRDQVRCTVVRLTSAGSVLSALVRHGEEYEEVPLAELTKEIVLSAWAERPELRESANDDWLIATLPDDADKEMRKRLAVVVEIETGHRPGHEQNQRLAYDLTRTSLNQRIAAAADELGVSTRTVHRWLKAHRKGGAASLVHGNRVLGNPLDLYPAEVVRVARAVVEEELTSSTRSLSNLNARLNQRLEDHGHARLSAYRATNLLNEISRGMSLRGTAKTKKSKKSRPKGSRGYVRPSIANEVWEVDSTRLDVLAYSPLTPNGVPVYGVFVIDQCTRLLSIHLTLSPPSATSVAIALHRRMNPLRLDAALAPAGAAIPSGLEAPEDSPLVHPGGIPGEIHSDHGAEYENEMVLSLLATLGIDLVLARPRSGADKPHIEVAIRTVNHTLVQLLPGYKGRSADHRGEHPHREQLATLQQLRTITDGFCLAYNNHPHTGLIHPAQLGTYMTPMDAYAASILAGAPLRIDADVNLLFRFLPTKAAVVSGRGPTIDGIVYNSDDIAVMRRLSAGDQQVKGRPLAFHYDPSNRSEVHWHEPGTARWHTLTAVGHHGAAIPPLSDVTFERALGIGGKRRANKQDSTDQALAIATYVREMLDETPGSQAMRKEWNRYQERLAEFAGSPSKSTRKRPRTTTPPTAPVFDFGLDEYVEEIDNDLDDPPVA